MCEKEQKEARYINRQMVVSKSTISWYPTPPSVGYECTTLVPFNEQSVLTFNYSLKSYCTPYVLHTALHFITDIESTHNTQSHT